MGSGVSYLKQWIVIESTHGNKDIYLSNNHYLHGWFQNRGYTSIRNVVSKKDLNELIIAINDLGSFDIHFPESYIKNYTLWNMEKKIYWQDIQTYKLHIKKELDILNYGFLDLNEDSIVHYIICN